MTPGMQKARDDMWDLGGEEDTSWISFFATLYEAWWNHRDVTHVNQRASCPNEETNPNSSVFGSSPGRTRVGQRTAPKSNAHAPGRKKKGTRREREANGPKIYSL